MRLIANGYISQFMIVLASQPSLVGALMSFRDGLGKLAIHTIQILELSTSAALRLCHVSEASADSIYPSTHPPWGVRPYYPYGWYPHGGWMGG